MKKSLSSIRFTQISHRAIFFCAVALVVGVIAGLTLVYELTNLVKEAKYDTARAKGLNLATYIEDELQKALEQRGLRTDASGKTLSQDEPSEDESRGTQQQDEPEFSNVSEAADLLNNELRRLGLHYMDIKNIMVTDIGDSVSPGKVVAIWPPELMGIKHPCSLPFRKSIAWRGATRHKGPAGEGEELCLGRTLGYHTRPFGFVVMHQSLDIVESEVLQAHKDISVVVASALAVMYLVLGCIAYRSVQEVRKSEREKESSVRLAALGNLAAGIAHEIRNPLNTISLTCQYLQRLVSRNRATGDGGAKEPTSNQKIELAGQVQREVSDNFRLVSDELTRLKETIEDFIKFARPTELKLERIEITILLSETLKLFEQEFRQSNIEVALSIDDGAAVMADPQKMRQVFSNVISNAIQAMPEGGSFRAEAKLRRGKVQFSFHDSGAGVSPENLDRVFEPYFSTKRNGLGLGLALSRNIVESHHGYMEVRSALGKGTTMIIGLPCESA